MSTTTIERQATAALHVITQHAVDHCLPAPMSIDRDAEGIEVTIVSTDAPRWLATVHVDSRHTEQRTHAYVTRHTVRLPDTGVQFRLRYLHLHRDAIVGSLLAWNQAAAGVDVAVGHAEDWHRACERDDCGQTVCLQSPFDPDHDAASCCEHGYCDSHQADCEVCSSMARTDARF